MFSISFVIPTFNRGEKVLRLLQNIDTELSELSDYEKANIEILISDNASTDNTKNLIKSFKSDNFCTNYFRQEINIGFDANCRFLFDQSSNDYVWFFADDDILLPGSIKTVIRGLEKDPTILLFSFTQPPGSLIRTFNFENKFELITDPRLAIELIAKYPKVSLYIAKKNAYIT